MSLLFAVQPDWGGVLYSVVEGREVIRLRGSDRVETRIEDRVVGLVEKGLADVVKGGLRDAVVLLLENKLDNVARSSRQGFWLEGELFCGVVAADDNLMDQLSGGDREEGEHNKRSGEHYVRNVRGTSRQKLDEKT